MDAKAAGPFTLPKLPWDEGALDPVISARTMQFHYGKHHKTYVDFWNCLRPGGSKPSGDIARRIESDLGGLEAFNKNFAKAAVECFGSGWAWLVDRSGKLEILATSNAGTPLTMGATPLLTLDVWEHAYYLDYQNRRPDFANAVIGKLLNWEFAAENLSKSGQRKAA